MRTWYIIIFACFALSCRNKQQPANIKDTMVVEENPKTTQTEIHETDPVPVADTTKKLLSYATNHIFTDTKRKDNFAITLYGNSIIEGVVVFKITDGKQKELLKEVFWSVDLLGDMADGLSSKQKEDTIKVRMAHFFDQNRFSAPAIAHSEKIDNAFPNYEKSDEDNWADVKADSTAVGFFYSCGYESTYGIAFSKKKKKVVEIFYSD